MKALFIKEIFSYFKSKFFYAMMSVYAIVSMICCFYISKFFEIITNNLNALFYFQPNILAFIIPAIAVKLWSEERRNNTIELLASQPISYFDVVAAKFLSVFCLGFVMLLLTVPFLIFASFKINLDYLSVATSYLATLLAIGLIGAVSCMVASFFISPAIAYLVSLFVIWLLFLMGFYNHFADVLYGQIGFNNIFYFIVLMFISLSVNLFLIKQKFEKNKFVFYYVLLQFTLGFLLIVVFNLLFFHYKLDVSYSKEFSLSDDAKEVFGSYKEPVIIDLYASDFSNIDAKKQDYIKNVTRFLKQIPNSTLNVKKIRPYSVEETEAYGYGIEYVQTPKYNLYAGIVVASNKKKNVINKIEPNNVAFLEADVLRAVNALQMNRKTIGLLVGRPAVLRKPYGIKKGTDWPFVSELKKYYNLISLSENTFEVPAGIDILLILHQPKSILLKYAIDQYLMRGGKVLILDNNIDFAYDNKSLNSNEDVVLYEGKFSSEYDRNIVKDEEIAANMLVHLLSSINNPILIEINDNLIGDKQGFNREEFEVLLKNLDYLSEDNTFDNIGAKQNVVDLQSIKDKVEDKISEKYLQEAQNIANEIEVLNDGILSADFNDDMDIKEFQKVNSIQEEILIKEEDVKRIGYMVEEKTAFVIMSYILLNIFVYPFLLMIAFIVAFELLRRKYVKI